ncbi:YlaF family protein [Cytobacillus sp. Hz8]|uniref:YlaF family protein n=1 Tax=Cytobacillus sp. Hz8 TaxID=3347168 RepID=UPI0035D8437F
MDKIKLLFLLFAFAGVTCMTGIGIAVAEESVIGVILALLCLVFIMGMGFSMKKKMRESGRL